MMPSMVSAVPQITRGDSGEPQRWRRSYDTGRRREKNGVMITKRKRTEEKRRRDGGRVGSSGGNDVTIEVEKTAESIPAAALHT